MDDHSLRSDAAEEESRLVVKKGKTEHLLVEDDDEDLRSYDAKSIFSTSKSTNTSKSLSSDDFDSRKSRKAREKDAADSTDYYLRRSSRFGLGRFGRAALSERARVDAEGKAFDSPRAPVRQSQLESLFDPDSRRWVPWEPGDGERFPHGYRGEGPQQWLRDDIRADSAPTAGENRGSSARPHEYSPKPSLHESVSSDATNNSEFDEIVEVIVKEFLESLENAFPGPRPSLFGLGNLDFQAAQVKIEKLLDEYLRATIAVHFPSGSLDLLDIIRAYARSIAAGFCRGAPLSSGKHFPSFDVSPQLEILNSMGKAQGIIVQEQTVNAGRPAHGIRSNDTGAQSLNQADHLPRFYSQNTNENAYWTSNRGTANESFVKPQVQYGREDDYMVRHEKTFRFFFDHMRQQTEFKDLTYYCHFILYQEVTKVLHDHIASSIHWHRAPAMRALTILESAWDPVPILRLYLENRDCQNPLDNILTVTGTFDFAVVKRCRDYVDEYFRPTGKFVLDAINNELSKVLNVQSPKGTTENLNTYELPGPYVTTTRIIFGSTPTINIDFEGDFVDATRILQIFAWLTAAVRLPGPGPSPQEARISLGTHGDSMIKINCHTELAMNDRQMPCWTSLLDRAVIAYGFPVPRRSYGRGIELPLALASQLIDASRVTRIDGSPVILGYSGMLLPTRVIGAISGDQTGRAGIQWHLVVNDNLDEPMTFEQGIDSCHDRLLEIDLPSRCRNDKNLDWNAAFQCYVGWHANAVCRAGKSADEIDYKSIRKSGLDGSGSRFELRSFTLGFQHIVTAEATASFVPIQSSIFYQAKTRRYRGIVRQAAKKRVLLYDTTSDRAWFLTCADVILHMIQYRLVQDSEDQKQGAETSIRYGTTPMDTLLINSELDLGEGINFAQCVRSLWDTLEFVRTELNNRWGTDRFSRTLMGQTLMGAEFMACAEEQSEIPIRKKVISRGGFFGPSWVDLVIGDGALALFGSGFGELIGLPTDQSKSICPLWRTVPCNASLMTMMTAVLQQMYDEEPQLPDRPSHISLTPKKLTWTQRGSKLFEACQQPTTDCCCQRIQTIMSESKMLALCHRKTTGRITLPPDGALIFGDQDTVDRRPNRIVKVPKPLPWQRVTGITEGPMAALPDLCVQGPEHSTENASATVDPFDTMNGCLEEGERPSPAQ